MRRGAVDQGAQGDDDHGDGDKDEGVGEPAFGPGGESYGDADQRPFPFGGLRCHGRLLDFAIFGFSDFWILRFLDFIRVFSFTLAWRRHLGSATNRPSGFYAHQAQLKMKAPAPITITSAAMIQCRAVQLCMIIVDSCCEHYSLIPESRPRARSTDSHSSRRR
jgi:hypothetical protein